MLLRMNRNRFTDLSVRALPALISACVVAAVTLPASASAGVIYRCESADGVVEYSNSLPSGKAAKACREIELPNITTIPAPPPQAAVTAKPAPAAKSASTATAKGSISASTQATRDNDRAQILRDELEREEQRLATMKSEYNDGEPDRRGDERNYQKYLDRVESLKAGITRGEANIKALRRELAALK